jgi:hypothetical protein
VHRNNYPRIRWRSSGNHVYATFSARRTWANLGRETFENIYLDLSKQPGRCRLAETGLGWKPSGGSEPFTLEGKEIGGAQWSRASKGYELKLVTREGDVIQLDGFEQEVRACSYRFCSNILTSTGLRSRQ